MTTVGNIFLCCKLNIAIALLCTQAMASDQMLATPGEEHFRIAGYPQTIKVFLRHLPPARRNNAMKENTVLFVHGATFPSALAAAFKFDGKAATNSIAKSRLFWKRMTKIDDRWTDSSARSQEKKQEQYDCCYF
jgi:hypothetical protein